VGGVKNSDARDPVRSRGPAPPLRSGRNLGSNGVERRVRSSSRVEPDTLTAHCAQALVIFLPTSTSNTTLWGSSSCPPRTETSRPAFRTGLSPTPERTRVSKRRPVRRRGDEEGGGGRCPTPLGVLSRGCSGERRAPGADHLERILAGEVDAGRVLALRGGGGRSGRSRNHVVTPAPGAFTHRLPSETR